MSVHKDYPDGCGPSAGPFVIEGDAVIIEISKANVVVDDATVDLVIADPALNFRFATWITSDQARDAAAALIELADFIDRQNMTAEDKAKDAGDGR